MYLSPRISTLWNSPLSRTFSSNHSAIHSNNFYINVYNSFQYSTKYQFESTKQQFCSLYYAYKVKIAVMQPPGKISESTNIYWQIHLCSRLILKAPRILCFHLFARIDMLTRPVTRSSKIKHFDVRKAENGHWSRPRWSFDQTSGH